MGGFPLDSWSATSVHIARGNMRLDLKILLDLGARALASPNRAPPLKRSLCEKQRTTTLPSLAALASGSFSSHPPHPLFIQTIYQPDQSFPEPTRGFTGVRIGTRYRVIVNSTE